MEEQNNIVQEQKKKGNGLVVGLLTIVIILLVGVIALLVFKPDYFKLGGDNGSTNGGTDTEVTTKEESLEVESDLVKKLDRNITTAGAPYYGGFYELFTDKKMTANDLSDEAKGKVIALRLYDKVNTGNGFNWEGTTYTKAEVEEMYKSVFGSDVSIKHMSIGACPSIDYDATTETYKVGPSGCGGTTGPYHERHKVVTAVKKGNELTLSIRVVFGDGSKYYSDYAKTKEVPEDKDAYGGPTITDFSKGSLYKAVFKLENGNYGLSYVEPVKD